MTNSSVGMADITRVPEYVLIEVKVTTQGEAHSRYMWKDKDNVQLLLRF